MTKRIDSSCSVRCHALHDCQQTWSFQQSSSSKFASARNVIIPGSSPTSCVASNMCASARDVIIPDQLRSIQHVCKCKECYHPRPVAWHPTCVQVQGMLSSPTSCVASNMCASARNVIIPDQLRSIQHVCRCKECYHPIPPHPPTPTVAQHQTCVHVQRMLTSHPTPPQPQLLRSIKHVFMCNEC